MSWTLDRRLKSVDFDLADKEVPDLPLEVLSGKIATVSLGQSKSLIELPNKERYWPDAVLVCKSGVKGIEPGDVWLVASGHGAFLPNFSPDGREVRLFGVVCPWWDSFVAKVSEHGLAPGPSWTMILQDKAENKFLMDEKPPKRGVIVADNNGPAGSNEGDYVDFSHFEGYESEGFMFVQAQTASRGWLRRLSC